MATHDRQALVHYVEREAKAAGYSLLPVPRRPDRYALLGITGTPVTSGTLGYLASWLEGRGVRQELPAS